jgi:hypothetical protein
MSLHTWKSRGMPSPDQELIEHTRALFSRAKKASVESLDLVKKGEEYIEKTLTV